MVLKCNNVSAYKKFSKEKGNKIRAEKKLVCRLLQLAQTLQFRKKIMFRSKKYLRQNRRLRYGGEAARNAIRCCLEQLRSGCHLHNLLVLGPN